MFHIKLRAGVLVGEPVSYQLLIGLPLLYKVIFYLYNGQALASRKKRADIGVMDKILLNGIPCKSMLKVKKKIASHNNRLDRRVVEGIFQILLS